MERPTRQEQAAAILGLKAQRMASQILGRRASGRDDFEEAFNLEWVDIITEIPDDDALLALYKAGSITLEEAMSHADSRSNLEAKINFGG